MVHTITKAKKSHDLPSASWRMRKASGTIQSESKSPRTGGPTVEVLPELRIWKAHERGALISLGRRRMSQSRQRERNPPFLCFFVPLGPSMNWLTPSSMDESYLLYSVYKFKCYSFLEAPSKTPPEIMFYQLSEHPLLQSS